MQASIQNTNCIITEWPRNRLTLSATEITEVLHSGALNTLLFCLSGSCWAGSRGPALLWPSLRCGWLACPLPCTAKPPRDRAGFSLVPLHVPVPDLRQLRRPCERPAPTKAASPLTWLPEKAEPGSERETVRVLGGLYFCFIFHQVRF